MPHFFASDLGSLAIAFLLGIPVIVVPGYGFGWWLNLLGFRSEPPETRWSWALMFGLTMEPILLFLPFRLISAKAMLITWVILTLIGVFAISRRNVLPRWKAIPGRVKVAVVITVGLCIFLMLDVVTSSGVYPPSQVVDTSFRSQVITSVATSDHLPPRSMFFNPGHTTPLKYHYVFFLLSGLMMRLGFGVVTARMALVALSMWVALAMLAVVAITIRFFCTFSDNARATRIAWVLLLVGGLDILPVGAEILARCLRGEPNIIPYVDINFWNGWGMAFGWLDTLLWSSHHLAGLMGCVLGCLLLWNARDFTGFDRWIAAGAAALCFAMAAGTSIYVTAIFAVFLLILSIELLLNAPRYLAQVLVAGVIAAILATTFLFDVRTSAGSGTASVFEFAVRPYQPVIFLYEYLGIRSPLAWNLTYLISLPLNYLFEFGLFFVVGIWWFYKRRNTTAPLSVKDHVVIGLLVISLVAPAIIWSGMEYSNDFGYRGVLPAQFILLLWGTQFFCEEYRGTLTSIGALFRRTSIIALLLGLVTTGCNAFLLRTTIGNFEQGTVLSGQMLRPNYSAQRYRDLRAAYIWLQSNTPPGTVLQENPVTWQLLAEGEYSQRPAVVYGSNPSFMLGVDHSEYLQVARDVRELFQYQVTGEYLRETCRRYGLLYLVLADGDPAWANKKSYVWAQAPVFATDTVRVLHCEQ